jgi:environmental stress-induced protein Ves
MSAFRAVPSATLQRQRWANGHGSTLQLACGPDDVHWRWRLSQAQIDQDAAFSSYPGVQRLFAALDTAVTLVFPDGTERPLGRLEVHAFDGADAPQVRLHEGATRAFNLMLRDGARGELIVRPLTGAMLLPVATGWRWFVHLLAGHADVRVDDEHRALNPADSLWIDARPGQRLRIDGGGEIVLVRLAD